MFLILDGNKLKKIMGENGAKGDGREDVVGARESEVGLRKGDAMGLPMWKGPNNK